MNKIKPMITSEQMKSWANTNLVARAEMNGKIYELNDNDVIYVLERETPEPKKSGQSSMLQLIDIAEPRQGLKDYIIRNNK